MKKLTIFFLLIVFATVSDGARACLRGLDSQRKSPVAVGDVAPDFTLEDHNGSKVTLSDSRNKNPVVLVFYRGYW